MITKRKPALAIVLCTLVLAGPASLQASELKLIPLMYNGGYGEWQNEGRAITPDGAYVVGVEYKSNTVYQAWMDGFFYNVTNSTVHIPLENSPPRILTGVGYRTSGAVRQVVASGYDQANFVQSEWMTSNGGTAWGGIRRNTSFAECINPALANALGSSAASDTYYVVVGSANTATGSANNQRHAYTGNASGAWPATMNLYNRYAAIENPDAAHWTGVASTGAAAGRAVGWYRDNYTYAPNQSNLICIAEYPPLGPIGYPASYGNLWSFRGLQNNTNGELWSVSADGTKMFGRSPTSFDSGWHAFKAVVGTGKNSWVRTDRLPDFSNTGGALMLACPYGCTPDGRYAVGMNYRGVERAVIWDTGDANPANWTVTDLTEVATAEGLMGTAPNPRWLALTRAHSVGTNAAGDPVITGFGYYFDGTANYNRGFVLTLSRCAMVSKSATIAAPVYDYATTVTVTNCSPAASAIKVYHDSTLIGSAAGGAAATVQVTVAPPSLVAGWTLKVTQTINGQESCLNTAPSVVVTTGSAPPPTVALTAPASGSRYTTPATISLAATVNPGYNTINYVRFYNWGTNLIATLTAAPYSYPWTGVPAGSYSLTAQVGYNSAFTVDSSPVVVTVDPPASGSGLTAIPMPAWATGRNNSQARAVTLDGKYVVGVCYATTPPGLGFFYDVTSGSVIQPSASSHVDQQYPPSMLTGIGYRTDPIYGKQVVMDGMVSGFQANWSTTDGGATWGAARVDTSWVESFALPTANSLGAATGSGNFYTIVGGYATDINNQREVFVCRGSGPWSVSSPCAFEVDWFYIDYPDAGMFNGVAALTGRTVGYYRDAYLDSGKRHNCVVEYAPPGSIGYPASYAKTWEFNGLDGTKVGEAFSVSADGTKIFGRSPTNSSDQTYWAGYKAIATAASNSVSSVRRLPDFPNTGGSVSLATPYGCSADGRYAVGMNYRGMERAVLWDTGDANSANWTVTDLTDRAAAEGILGNFTRLYRAFSVGTNAYGNPVVVGVGTYNDGSGTYDRAFMMAIGTPRPRITLVTGAGTGSVTVAYTNTLAGKSYFLQYRDDLSTGSWLPAGSKAALATSDFQTHVTPATTHRYYRIYTP